MTIQHGLFQVCIGLFVIGGLLGVLMEGAWWRYRYGFWQTHTTLLWSPLCTIYSFGCVGCYLGALLFMEHNPIVRFLLLASRVRSWNAPAVRWCTMGLACAPGIIPILF